jgi:hypothetical protein
LAGVIARVCDELDVAYFSCRGYVSQSEMWGAAQRFIQRAKAGQRTEVIHLGDHDPSGIDMGRDIEERIRMFMTRHLGRSTVFSLQRIALNRDQIDQYDPPPNPAKMSDARFTSYANQYGDESWELDALEPRVLMQLVTDRVAEIRQDDIYQNAQAIEDDHRRLLTQCSERWYDVIDLLKEE